MAYVNVAEWTSQHVGDWLYGLDDSILPYVQFFVNNQINGCKLLLLNAQDLVNLNIHKIGHQEIILEAVELLRNLHYNITSETLQTIALRLACKSRALLNQLKKSAEKAAAEEAARKALESFAPCCDHHNDNHHQHHHHHHHSKKKDKDKDHHHHHYHGRNNSVKHQYQHQQPNIHNQQQPTKTEDLVDLSPVSTSTLASVSDILAAVKDFISWIDRYPFDRNEKYLQTRKSILQLSIELTSTAQRDQFVQGPNEVIKKSCKKLADLCDRLVQELNDSLAMQSASLEVVTVTKNIDEDLGMHIHSSYSGIHVVGGLKYHSPAHLNGNIEEGDEIVQVNYQTVVGWQLKKLVSSMRRFPTKLILTVKKRPRHHASGTFVIVPQFSLPLPEMSIIGNSSLPLATSGLSTYLTSTPAPLLQQQQQQQYGATNMMAGYPPGATAILGPMQPTQSLPAAATTATVALNSVAAGNINDNITTAATFERNSQAYQTYPGGVGVSGIVTGENVRSIVSETIPASTNIVAAATMAQTNPMAPQMTTSNTYDTLDLISANNNCNINDQPQNRKPIMFGFQSSASIPPLPIANVLNHSFDQNNLQELGAKNINDSQTQSQQQRQQQSTITQPTANTENVKQMKKTKTNRRGHNHHHHHHHHHPPRHPHHRIATTRGSSASDSSPLSDLSDSSTMFSSECTSDSDSGNDDCHEGTNSSSSHHITSGRHHRSGTIVENKKTTSIKTINTNNVVTSGQSSASAAAAAAVSTTAAAMMKDRQGGETKKASPSKKQKQKVKKSNSKKQQQQKKIINGLIVSESERASFEEDEDHEEKEKKREKNKKEKREETNDNDSAFYSGHRTINPISAELISKTDSKTTGSIKGNKSGANAGGGGASSSVSSSSSCCSSSKRNSIANAFVKMRLIGSKLRLTSNSITSNNNNVNNNANNINANSNCSANEEEGRNSGTNSSLGNGNESTDSGIRESKDGDGPPSSSFSEYYTHSMSAINNQDNDHPTMDRSNQKPRTSAEFEELYLKKNFGGSGPMLTSSATGDDISTRSASKSPHKELQRASTLPPNTQPNMMMAMTTVLLDKDQSSASLSSSSSSPPPVVMTSINQQQPQVTTSCPSSTFTSLQLSTITHLTSLAKNIRFANMAQVQSNVQQQQQHQQPPFHLQNPHSKSKFDPILAQNIEKTITKMSDGDLVMGNHEDYLYTYKGSERIGGNSSDIASLGYIKDPEKLLKWTKIRSVLKDNCLYSYLDQSLIACFEIPIHLPGYYILVDKQMFITPNVETQEKDHQQQIDVDHPKQLVVFKLVTYHRLFMFAVPSLKKLIRWIIRFGYRFCCNPNDQQLCFTYYLSPAHVGESSLSSSTSSVSTTLSSSKTSPAIFSMSKGRKSLELNENLLTSAPTTTKTATSPSIQSKKSAIIKRPTDLSLNIQKNNSESDDYYNELTIKSSNDGDANVVENYDEDFDEEEDLSNLHVKFDFENIPNLSGSKQDLNEDEENLKDAHRFIKSPHPRGSVRFAVKPPPGHDVPDFIDSTVDAKKVLANYQQDEQKTNSSSQSSSSTSSSKKSFLNQMVSMLPSSASSSTLATEQQKQPQQQQQKSLTLTRPPDLPPRTSLTFGNQCQSITTDSVTTTTIPRPKPRISKMAVTGSNGTNSGNGSMTSNTPPPLSPTKASSITSAAQRSAPNGTPVPVPEKSAAISQTIQHFANLQRQNNLRRSFAQQQQQQQQQQQKQNSLLRNQMLNLGNQNGNNNNQQQQPQQQTPQKQYSDYDYITNHSSLSNGQKQTTNSVSSPASTMATMATSSIIGNPLYCHVALVRSPSENNEQNQQQQQQQHHLSNVEREYNRLFGDRKPSEVLGSNSTKTNNLDGSSSTTESSDNDNDHKNNKLPPLIDPPPPPLPPPRPTTEPPPLDDDNNNNTATATATNISTISIMSNSFSANTLSSPKVQARRMNKKHPTTPPAISTNTNSIVPPPKPNRTDNNSNNNNAYNNANYSLNSPPTLFPRRSSGQVSKVPPPLPTTSHPQLYRFKQQQQQQQQQQSIPTPAPPPKPCPKPDTMRLSSSKTINQLDQHQQQPQQSGKFLNRSFSDAAYGGGRGSTVATNPNDMVLIMANNNSSSNSNNNNNSSNNNINSSSSQLLSSSSSLSSSMSASVTTYHNNNYESVAFRAGSAASFSGGLPSTTNTTAATMDNCSIAASSNGQLFDTSPSSNRSLPTMGVTMLGKKRLSNVSSDSSAIEKAISIHQQQQQQQQQPRRESIEDQ